jgi:hypothetical protein
LRHGFGSCFGHACAERGREASWYAFQREALDRGCEGMAEIETKPCGIGPYIVAVYLAPGLSQNLKETNILRTLKKSQNGATPAIRRNQIVGFFLIASPYILQ